MRIQYTRDERGAALLSCFGEGDSVALPASVDGYPVRAIGSYAFSSPEDAAARAPADARMSASDTAAPGDARFLGGRGLREAALPSSLEEVGAYAFYNCTALERLSLPGGPVQLASGAFMNCWALGDVAFDAPPDGETCLPALLGELQREVRVAFRADGRVAAALLFPEYFEEYEENTPARILEYYLHGAGYRYRQCFSHGRLDYADYDAQFATAENKAGRAEAIRIALLRLRYPFALLPSAGGRYRSYLAAHGVEAARAVIADDDTDALSFLLREGLLGPDEADATLEAAARLRRPACQSLLLEALRGRAGSERSFDL